MMILLLVLVVTGPYPAIASSRDHTIAAAILEVIFLLHEQTSRRLPAFFFVIGKA
jgi:hypothetical protein